MNRNDHNIFVEENGETKLIATVPIRPAWGLLVTLNAGMCEDGSHLRVCGGNRHEAVLDGKVVRVYRSEPIPKQTNASILRDPFAVNNDRVASWSTALIVQAVQGALRSGAKKEFYTSVGGSRVYIQHADQIRFLDGFEGSAQVKIMGEWEDTTVRGIGELAQQERLNWCMDDGAVWMHHQDIMTLPGAG